MSDSNLPSLTLTKLQRPRVGRGLVARAQLLQRLAAPESLTLVLAPAGYGKTTLLSMWLETCDLPHAWLSLDEHDDDLVVFVAYLTRALHTLFPAAVVETFSVMNAVAAPPPRAVARSLLNDLAAVEQDFILVLDDYHVIRDPAIHELITEIVRHPPRALHLVIASRHDPPLPLADFRAHGAVTELRAADLRFTLEEAEHFLVETMALSVDEQFVATLVNRTEGWPAGLRLVALSLRQRSAPSTLPLDNLSDTRYVMDYLMTEVLAQLPISVQEFLIKTAILDQLCSPLCEAVTGMTDRMFSGQYILEWLERADLFVIPIDDQQYWFRCHHLFRQLLRERLRQLHGPTEIAALHLRASTWFVANGYPDEALHHALAAGDTAAAVQIVAQYRHDLMNHAQWQRLHRWLRLFPPAVVDEQPDLLLIRVWMRFIQQRLAEIPPLLDRAETLLAQLSIETADRLRGEIASRRSAFAYFRGEIAASLTLAQQALAQVPLQWWYVRGYARLFLAASHQAAGDLPQAYATLDETGESNQEPAYQNLLRGAVCFIHWLAADLASLGRAAQQVVANSGPADRAELTAFSQFFLGYYCYQHNDLAAAEKYLRPLVMQPHTLHVACFLNSAVVMARICQMQGRSQEASDIAELAASFALEINSDMLLLGVQALQADLALRQGRLADAGQWAAAQLSAQAGSFRRLPAPFPFVPPLTLAQILLAQDTPASRQQARLFLAQMEEYYTTIHYTVVLIQVRALQALLASAEGDEASALAALSNSIALAAPGGFLRLFVDLGVALKPLLHKLAQRGESPAYINQILATFSPGETRSSADPRPIAPASPLTNREQDVLALLAERYTDKEIAEALSISPESLFKKSLLSLTDETQTLSHRLD
jgi:LuxR family maltose regulon positive regulatory protein